MIDSLCDISIKYNNKHILIFLINLTQTRKSKISVLLLQMFSRTKKKYKQIKETLYCLWAEVLLRHKDKHAVDKSLKTTTLNYN